jgi:hypothetical protein
VHFLLSHFKGGLPEKVAANFVDKIMFATPPNWGTYNACYTLCDNAFKDTNKKTNAENQLMLLKQGSKMAEEFFQEFKQMVQTAGYQDTHHNNALIKLLHDAIKTSIIDNIYRQPALPTNYEGWKTTIKNIDGLAHQ